MKNKFITFILFISTFSMVAQEINIVMVEFASNHHVPTFTQKNGLFTYNGKDKNKVKFFNRYDILDFYQSFPHSKRERTLNIYTFVTYNSNFGSQIMEEFLSEIVSYQDTSSFKVELTNSYPNDYGATSPITNLGVSTGVSGHDYVNVPKAWDYTYGDDNIIIGISDGKIDGNDLDFSSKITFLPGYIYHSTPYSLADIANWHGTSTAAIATAQGNNSHGTVGVCSDCSILATAYGYGSPGTYTNPNPNFNNLLQLALNGARVINMSWTGYDLYPNNYYQWIIDEIHDMGVVLVASSGNESLTNSTSDIYPFPASFNHVISVSSVNHLNNLYDNTGIDSTVPASSPFYGATFSYYVKDMISPRVVPNFNGTGILASVTDAPNKLHNTNNQVDICAPGWQTFQYSWYVLDRKFSNGNPMYYGDGTSNAAPYVSGTIGLMLSLNDCLSPDEIEDILQLTAKNLENIEGNEYFIGRIGAGKLETGDAVEFVSEALSSLGNAVIEGNDFWRFNFDLQNINNKLTISNQTFRDNNTSNFIAKNSIHILPNTHLKPNSSGYINLKVDNNVSACTTGNKGSFTQNKEVSKTIKENKAAFIIYPNPNNGIFNIDFGKSDSDRTIEIVILDLNGRSVFSKILTSDNLIENQTFNCNLNNIMKSVYILKITENNETITKKLIIK